MKAAKILKRKKRLLAVGVLLLFVLAVRSCTPKRGEYIGTYDVSHYCLERWDGYHICGNSEYGCREDKLIPGKSVAVPESLLERYPVGTKIMAVYPDGNKDILVIHDTGRALERLGRIDLPVKTHREAMKLGVIYGVELYTVK